MKQSTISFGFILFTIVVLFTEVTSTSSYGLGVKQCAFNKLNDGRENGQIMTCDFQKVFSNSALRVTYQGVLRLIQTSNGYCGRWYLTINGKECSSPQPIDTVIYSYGTKGLNIHRASPLDGFCNNIPAGRVTVGLSVGKCSGYSVGDAFTCWNSACRLIIEEVPLMQ